MLSNACVTRPNENGHLKSNEQVTVSAADTVIVVQPTRTEYVYVPVYNSPCCLLCPLRWLYDLCSL
jgi:Protein of unknown function (DUF3300).